MAPQASQVVGPSPEGKSLQHVAFVEESLRARTVLGVPRVGSASEPPWASRAEPSVLEGKRLPREAFVGYAWSAMVAVEVPLERLAPKAFVVPSASLAELWEWRRNPLLRGAFAEVGLSAKVALEVLLEQLASKSPWDG